MTHMPVQFKAASKQAAKLRMALAGPAGSGKTYSALAVASQLGSRIAVVDTERGSASKYADLFKFDVLELESFHPDRYVEAIQAADAAGYDVLVVDSLSHAWMGKDGALELKDRASRRQGINDWTAWREVTPSHNAMVDAILASNMHVLVTMRSKTEYVQEKDSTGKTAIRKVGMAPVQRDGLEYEFDVYGDLDQDNTLIIGKTRCSALAGAVIKKPGEQLAKVLTTWLTDGVATPAAPAPATFTPAENGRDMVRTADDPLWKSWLVLLGKAEAAHIKAPEVRLPVDRNDLKETGAQLKASILVGAR